MTKPLAAVALGALALVPAGSADAAPIAPTPPPAEHVIVVLLDRVRVEEFAVIPGIDELAARGGVGLLSAAGRGVASPIAGALTLSAGARALAPETFFVVPAGPVGERLRRGTVGDAYRARTGRPAPPAPDRGRLERGFLAEPFAFPDIALVARLGSRPEVRAEPGLLGETLDTEGVSRYVISLTDPSATRLAPLVAMDLEGLVPSGRAVSAELVPRVVASALGVARFVTVDAGGAETAETVVPGVLAAAGPGDAVIVVAPDPPGDVAQRHTWLTPIAAAGPGIGPGLLTSDSTRRSGVVSNVDVAPTILGWLGAEVPGGLLGTTIRSQPSDDPVGDATAAFERYERVAAQRGPVFRGALILTILALLLAVAASADREGGEPAEGVFPRAALLAAAAVPLVMLVEPVVASDQLGVTVLVVVGGSLLLGAILAATIRATATAFAAVAGATLAALTLDVLVGTPLGARSLLGFTVAGGTRFYGLGSEEAGAALAAMLLMAGFAVDRGRPRLRLAAYAGAAILGLVFAAPAFGAKFGMLFTAAPAFALAWTRFERRRVTARTVVAAGAVLAAGAGMVVGAALLLGPGGSHIGAETRALGQEGTGAAVSVFLRRGEVALRLLGTTFWSWLVVVGGAAWAFLAMRRREAFAEIAERRPGLRGVAAGLAAGSIAALLVNDAGAVIVATMVMVGVPAVAAEILLGEEGPAA